MKKIFLGCVAVLFGTVSVKAQFAEDVLRFSQFGLGVGASSLAVGNASVGQADDYSALFWNPAGLSQLKSYEFSVGASYLDYGNTTRFLGTRTQGSQSALNLNSLGLVYPVPTVRGGLTFAFGFNRVANYTTKTEFTGYNTSSSIVPSLIPDVDLSTLSQSSRDELLDNNIPYQLYLADISGNRLVTSITKDVQQTAVIREAGGMNHWSFGGAIDVAKDLSLGAAISLVSGSYSYDREYTETDLFNNYQKAPADTLGLFDRFRFVSTINSDLNGFNAVFGFHYRKQGKFKIGFTVRTPTYYTIEETFSDEAESWFDPNLNGTIDQFDIAFDEKTEYKIVTPVVVTLGGMVQFRDWLVLSGDLEYTDWRDMRFVTSRSALEFENRVIQGIYRPTFSFRGGMEVTLWHYGVKLRGGFQLKPSPYEGDPPEFDQQYYSAGAGLQLEENVWLDAGYAFGIWKTFRDNYYSGSTSGSRTNEHVKTHNAVVTLKFRF
ncbi:MAG: outer membrane protein transport protein [Ignavibacteriales bacterium]|nr:outer membrane protein transport protein [Ignavibacteriales bacterium]